MKRSQIRRKTPLRAKQAQRGSAGTGRNRPEPQTVDPGTDEGQQERACRALVEQRSKGMCEKCASPQGLQKAHRLARSQGGEWDAANILDLCHACHRTHHENPLDAYRGGWHLRRGQDPAETSVLLFKQGEYNPALLASDGTWRRIDTDLNVLY